jgi:hypothetical protein
MCDFISNHWPTLLVVLLMGAGVGVLYWIAIKLITSSSPDLIEKE